MANAKQQYPSKIDFLSELINMDRNEINQFIKDKGKGPKLICPIVFTEIRSPDKNNNNGGKSNGTDSK